MPDASLGLWGLLSALLLLSGAFSASETALFSLRPEERSAAPARLRRLLERPRDLLVTVLLGNLLINILFFAFVERLAHGAGGLQVFLVNLGALLALLVCGEIMPKTLGLRMRVRFARAAAPPLGLLVGLLGPARVSLIALLDWTCRLLGPLAKDEPALTPEDLAEVLERSAEHGLLSEDEADLMGEVVELDSIRVREIMTPRVDVIALTLDGANRESAVKLAVESHLSWLPVFDGHPDRVLGRVRVRDLLVHPERELAKLAMPVKFVPEVASLLDLLQTLREDRVSEAIVVDEWGGTAGVVTIEDVIEEIVGELRTEGEQRHIPAVPLGEGRFRVAGGLSIRDWNELFGYKVVPTEFETVGGFVTAQLGRIPRVGDAVEYGSLLMTVHEMRGRRILALDLEVRRATTIDGGDS